MPCYLCNVFNVLIYLSNELISVRLRWYQENYPSENCPPENYPRPSRRRLLTTKMPPENCPL